MSTILHHFRRHTAAALALGLALAAPSAWAAGTASGTDISNNATVNYQVGGVTQTSQSNTATFKVDNVVRLLVSESNNAATSAVPGASAQVTTFTVNNQGNTTQDYSLATANLPNTTPLTLGANNYVDAFDSQGACSIRVENGTTPGYQSSGANADTDQAILALPADQSRTVYVICDIPLGQANGNDAVVSLTATTANSGTCAANGTGCVTTSQTAGSDNPTQVDVVWGDVAGTDDVARDGKHSARDAYEITSAALSITKTVTPVCDPFNFNATPKNVPGAYVRYEITIANAAGSGQSATLTTITDALPAAIQFDADLRTGSAIACAASVPEKGPLPADLGNGFKLSCSTFVGNATPRACVATPVFYTGASDTDAITVAGQNVTVTAGNAPAGNKVLPSEGTYAVGELKPGESITIRFNAIIQ